MNEKPAPKDKECVMCGKSGKDMPDPEGKTVHPGDEQDGMAWTCAGCMEAMKQIPHAG
jgi:hypothetical protein